jgi:RNA polymerase primary sigma factor
MLFVALQKAKDDVERFDKIPNRTLNENSQMAAARRRVKGAETELVRANLPLVIRIAQRMECPGVTQEQFVEEGLMKLLSLIGYFKVELGYKFSTYAYRPLYRHFARFIQTELKRNAGRVAGVLDVFAGSWVYGETPRGSARFSWDRAIAEADSADVAELHEVLADNIAELSEIEMSAVQHRFGIIGPAKTLKELSEILEVSTGRVKAILAGALDKLRNVMAEETTDEAK